MGAKSAWPDLWDIALSERAPADARATLLTMQAEMFASAPARDRETVASFEAIALGFLPLVDPPTRQSVARLVAPCSDTPDAVLAYLTRASAETRTIVVALAPILPQTAIEILLGTTEGRVLLAVRTDLGAATAERLALVRQGAVEQALAYNRGLRSTDPVVTDLVARARHDPALGRALLQRGDLAASDEASLFLVAGPEERARIRQRVAGSALFQRSQLPLRPAPGEIDELLELAAGGDMAAFETALTRRLGLPAEIEWDLIADRRHDLLALGLVACGLTEEDATRIFLTLHPALSHSVPKVFRLVRLFREVARPVAVALVEAILGAPTAVERGGRHQPAMSPTGTSARPSHVLPERSREPGTDRHRRAN
jgi:Uncharacterised protein conserved in bacteria (DUF2336)